jgi:hypothetical protein
MDDIVGMIIEYEQGNLSPEEEIEFLQKLYDSRLVHHLQGRYVRRVLELIDADLISITSGEAPRD